MSTTRENIFWGLFWKFAERCGAQLMSFVVSVILARILEPEAYGIVALIMVFISILQIFIDSGLGNALIQKKNADNIDFSTVFFTNIGFCILLYLGIFLSAPVIAAFYDNMTLTPLIRVLSLIIVISALRNVQQAYVSRNMLFKRLFYSTLGGTFAGSIIGIYLAVAGYGVWALVIQQLVNAVTGTLLLWLLVEWRPDWCFSIKRLSRLFSYGWKLLVSGLLYSSYLNLWQLIIGKIYSPSDLAYFNQGKKFPALIVTNIDASLSSVLFPAMSKAQDDIGHLRNMVRRSIKLSVFIMAPLMMGLAFAASNVVTVVLTEKWLFCVPFIWVFCINYMFEPINTANQNAINAMGRSDLFLKLEVIKTLMELVILLLTMWHGMMAIAYGLIIIGFLRQMINAWPNRILLKYNYEDQIKDIFPSILLAMGMGICIYLLNMLHLSVDFTLILQIVIGIIIYIGGSIIFKIDSIKYILNIRKGIGKNKIHTEH